MITPLSPDETLRTIRALEFVNGNTAAAAENLHIPVRTMQARKLNLTRRGQYSEHKTAEFPTDKPLKIFVIPDAQVKAGVNTDHLEAAGHFIARKKPDVVVCIGDFADMPSLSSYDIGKKCYEGRTLVKDVMAVRAAMKRLMTPIKHEQTVSGYSPRLVMTLGNHEDRILREIENNRKLEGLISTASLDYEKWGWEIYPFKQPVVIGGVAFAHYLVSGVKGLPISTARAILTKRHQSSVVGHLQGRDVAYASRADGVRMAAIIAGSFYSHDEEYLGPQNNDHWRGMVALHEVRDGEFDEMFVSLDYLVNKYVKGSK